VGEEKGGGRLTERARRTATESGEALQSTDAYLRLSPNMLNVHPNFLHLMINHSVMHYSLLSFRFCFASCHKVIRELEQRVTSIDFSHGITGILDRYR
jgi:hypothetical protein